MTGFNKHAYFLFLYSYIQSTSEVTIDVFPSETNFASFIKTYDKVKHYTKSRKYVIKNNKGFDLSIQK